MAKLGNLSIFNFEIEKEWKKFIIQLPILYD